MRSFSNYVKLNEEKDVLFPDGLVSSKIEVTVDSSIAYEIVLSATKKYGEEAVEEAGAKEIVNFVIQCFVDNCLLDDVALTDYWGKEGDSCLDIFLGDEEPADDDASDDVSDDAEEVAELEDEVAEVESDIEDLEQLKDEVDELEDEVDDLEDEVEAVEEIAEEEIAEEEDKD